MNFNSFQFEKTSTEIKAKVEEKVLKLSQRILERECRVRELRDSHEIDEGALLQLLSQARRSNDANSYTFCTSASASPFLPQAKERTVVERTVGASVVNKLLDETEKMENEKGEIKRLETIMRNLRPYKVTGVHEGKQYNYATDSWKLSMEELDFLGF
jgi:hypothetical protein